MNIHPTLAIHEKTAAPRCQTPADFGAGIWVPSAGVERFIGGGPGSYSVSLSVCMDSWGVGESRTEKHGGTRIAVRQNAFSGKSFGQMHGLLGNFKKLFPCNCPAESTDTPGRKQKGFRKHLCICAIHSDSIPFRDFGRTPCCALPCTAVH